MSPDFHLLQSGVMWQHDGCYDQALCPVVCVSQTQQEAGSSREEQLTTYIGFFLCRNDVLETKALKEYLLLKEFILVGV